MEPQTTELLQLILEQTDLTFTQVKVHRKQIGRSLQLISQPTDNSTEQFTKKHLPKSL